MLKFINSSKSSTENLQLGVSEIAEQIGEHLATQNLCPSSMGTSLKHTEYIIIAFEELKKCSKTSNNHGRNQIYLVSYFNGKATGLYDEGC